MNTANGDFFAIGPHQRDLGGGAEHEADSHADDDGDADRDAPLAELVHDVGAEQRHLALGEVEVAGAAIDDDETERDQRVDAALAEAVEESLQEQFHQNPRYAFRMASSALSSSAMPLATMRPVSSR